MPGITFNDFFGISVKGFWTDVRSELISAFKGIVFTALTSAQWPSIISGITDKAAELFDVDLAWVMVST